MQPQAFIPIANYDQFLEDVEARVRRVLQSQNTSAIPFHAPTKEPKSVRQIAEKFDVCVATVWEWARAGKIISHKMGGRTYFFEEEVIAALETQQRSTKKGR